MDYEDGKAELKRLSSKQNLTEDEIIEKAILSMMFGEKKRSPKVLELITKRKQKEVMFWKKGNKYRR